MTPDRKAIIDGHIIEEYTWCGKAVVYIDNNATEESYHEAIQRLADKDARQIELEEIVRCTKEWIWSAQDTLASAQAAFDNAVKQRDSYLLDKQTKK